MSNTVVRGPKCSLLCIVKTISCKKKKKKKGKSKKDLRKRTVDLHKLGRPLEAVSKQLYDHQFNILDSLSLEEPKLSHSSDRKLVRMLRHNPETTKPQACHQLETAGTPPSFTTVKVSFIFVQGGCSPGCSAMHSQEYKCVRMFDRKQLHSACMNRCEWVKGHVVQSALGAQVEQKNARISPFTIYVTMNEESTAQERRLCFKINTFQKSFIVRQRLATLRRSIFGRIKVRVSNVRTLSNPCHCREQLPSMVVAASRSGAVLLPAELDHCSKQIG